MYTGKIMYLSISIILFVFSVLQERDPFKEDYDAECHIGSVKVWLQSMAYRIELSDQLEITDFKVGILGVSILSISNRTE